MYFAELASSVWNGENCSFSLLCFFINLAYHLVNKFAELKRKKKPQPIISQRQISKRD